MSSTDYMCGCRDSAALLTTVITLSPEHSSRIRAKPVTVVFQHEHGTSGVFYQSSLRTYSQPVPTFAVEQGFGVQDVIPCLLADRKMRFCSS